MLRYKIAVYIDVDETGLSTDALVKLPEAVRYAVQEAVEQGYENGFAATGESSEVDDVEFAPERTTNDGHRKMGVEVATVSVDDAFTRLDDLLDVLDMDGMAEMYSRYCDDGPVKISGYTTGASDVFQNGERIVD